MKPLRLAFAGTPDFAAVSLQALLDGPHTVAAVLTQPDRGAGRGKKVQPGPVKKLALAHDLPVLQPDTLKTDEIQNQLRDLALDALIVVAYGLIIPRAVLALPRLGCVNVHGSLLPRWRVPPRSSGRFRPATGKPAPPSCRWTPAWTPARCCSASR